MEQEQRQIESVVAQMVQNWPGPIVPRNKIEQFSAGLLSSKTLANLDSLSQGPAGAMRCGIKVFYPVESLKEWLISRMSMIGNNPNKKGDGHGPDGL